MNYRLKSDKNCSFRMSSITRMSTYFAILFIMFSINGGNSINCIKFFFKMTPNTNKCLGEYLTSNTVAIFSVNSEYEDILVKLYDPNGNTVYTKENNRKIKIAFTSSETGNHQLCIDNHSVSTNTIHFEFLSGIAAKDYSDVAKKSNLKPIELNLQKLEDMITYLIKELASIFVQEESSLALNDALSNKIILFSMITLVSMIFIGLIETIYIQRYLQKRKLI